MFSRFYTPQPLPLSLLSLTREIPSYPPPFLVNDYRTARVAEVLADFRNLQYYIAAAPANPTNVDDYYTEGWAALRQCALDGQHILNCSADVSVPEPGGGEEEQAKAELQQYVNPRLYCLFTLTRLFIHWVSCK